MLTNFPLHKKLFLQFVFLAELLWACVALKKKCCPCHLPFFQPAWHPQASQQPSPAGAVSELLAPPNNWGCHISCSLFFPALEKCKYFIVVINFPILFFKHLVGVIWWKGLKAWLQTQWHRAPAQGGENLIRSSLGEVINQARWQPFCLRLLQMWTCLIICSVISSWNVRKCQTVFTAQIPPTPTPQRAARASVRGKWEGLLRRALFAGKWGNSSGTKEGQKY